MLINPYFVIILFNLLILFPALKCLIIVDDIRMYSAIKEGKYLWKNFNPYADKPNNWYYKILKLIMFTAQRLYSGGTFGVEFNKKPHVWKKFEQTITGFTSIQYDHAFSIFLMCIIGCLMYVDFHNIWACLLFASSSVVTHIGVWLNGRRYAINIILTLLIVACIKAGWPWIILALPLYAATPLFHMTAFFAPIMYWPSIPVMILVLAIFWKPIYARVMSRLNSIFDCDRKYLKPKRIIVVIKTYGFYFFKMILPLQTRTCYGFLYMWGETPEGDKDAYAIDFNFFKGIVALLMSIGLCFFISRDYLSWTIFTILATLQWCNIINATQIVADRYICLPFVFFSAILAHILPWPIIALMVAINICFTSESYRMYENVKGMFDYHFYHWPNITLVNKEYIAWAIKSGDYIHAYSLVKECLKYNPTDFALLHAAAVCARVANQRQQARDYVDLAEKHLYFGQEEMQKRWINNFRKSM